MGAVNEIRLNKKFAYTVAIVLLLVAGYHLCFKQRTDWVLFAIAGLLLTLAVIKPSWLGPMRRVWDKVGHVLGIINGYILLTLFYVFVLTPLGLLMRLLGKDILKLRRSGSENTYWETTIKGSDSSMKNQF